MFTSPSKPRNPISYREGYDLWSADYDQFQNPMIFLTDWALDREPPDFRGKRVVELGCGTGRNANRVISSAGSSYCGVDGSPGMLRYARAGHPDPRVSWIEAAIDGPFSAPDASYDFVLIVLVLEHFTSLERVLQRSSKLLRPEGSIRILEIHPELVQGGTGAHFERGELTYQLPCFGHDEKEFKTDLTRCGFIHINVREWIVESELVSRFPKLTKHLGKKALLDVSAVLEGV